MVVKMAEFISACPALSGKKVCVNYLDGEVGAVALEFAPQQGQLKHYADGSSLCTQKFLIAVREEYGKADAVNRSVRERCKAIESWINEKNRLGQMPELGQQIQAVSCIIIRNFVPVATGSVDARYEAELELVFYDRSE